VYPRKSVSDLFFVCVSLCVSVAIKNLNRYLGIATKKKGSGRSGPVFQFESVNPTKMLLVVRYQDQIVSQRSSRNN